MKCFPQQKDKIYKSAKALVLSLNEWVTAETKPLVL